MTNALIGFPRHTDKVTFGGGSFDSSYPVTNLNTTELARVARTTDATPANTQFHGTLDLQSSIGLIALCGHNISIGATVRVRLYEDAARTVLLHDTGSLPIWERIFTDVPFQDRHFWTGTYTQEEVQGFTWYRPIRFTPAVLAKAFLVEISDAQNPAGYVDIGMCEVASLQELTINLGYGLEYGYQGRTERQVTPGGVSYHTRRPKPRTVRGDVDYAPRDEALTLFYEMQRLLDIETPFFFWPQPDEPGRTLQTAFLARFDRLSAIRMAAHERDSIPFQLIEVL